MTDTERKILMELAMVGDKANREVCKIADKYGIDRNKAIEVFMKCHTNANSGYDFSDMDIKGE